MADMEQIVSDDLVKYIIAALLQYQLCINMSAGYVC